MTKCSGDASGCNYHGTRRGLSLVCFTIYSTGKVKEW